MANVFDSSTVTILAYPLNNLDDANIVLPPCFSVMINFKTLCLGVETMRKCQRVSIEPTFDWRALVSLQQVKLSGEVSLSQQLKLSTLASMTTVRELRFTACRHPNDSYRLKGQLADLAYQLRKFRPDVDFEIG